MDLKDTEEYRECGFKIVRCPVCGHETLDFYWICEHCGWEYDGIIDEDTDSSANGMSVREYRQKYWKEA